MICKKLIHTKEFKFKLYSDLVSDRLLLLLSTCIHVQAQVFSSHVIFDKTSKTTIKIVGIKATKDFRWGPSGFNEEFAQKIILNLKEGEYCQIIKVTLSAKHFSPDKPVLLHIYSIHPSTGLPDKELLSKAHFITAENFQRNKIVIDIEKENLYVSENVFVSFEWLAHSKKPLPKLAPEQC